METEDTMGFFNKVGEKSTITIRREAAQIKHQAWHVDSLQFGRKRAWLDAAVAALAVAQAKLDAAEAEPINPETGEVRDTSAERIEVARLKAVVEKHERSVQEAEAKLAVLAAEKDQAAASLAIEEFLCGPLETADKALRAAHRAFQEVAKSPYGAEHSIPWLNDELVTAWTARKNARCNPPVRISRGPTETVELIANYSAGTYGGGLFVPGDRAAWNPELCAELVAQGIARWVTPSQEGEALVVTARKRLAQKKPFNAETDGARVDMGWAVNE